MKCKQVESLMSEHLDRSLDSRRAVEVSKHLLRCPRCELLARDLRRLKSEISSLEDHLPPESMFHNVLDASAATGASRTAWASFLRALRPIHVAAAATAAAALILVLAWPDPRISSPRAPTLSRPMESDEALMDSIAREFRRAEEHYQRAIAKLRKIAAEDSRSWPRSRRRAYERSLATIDQAVARCRRVVSKDPVVPLHQEVLFAAYRRQVQFLQDVILTEAVGASPRTAGGSSP